MRTRITKIFRWIYAVMVLLFLAGVLVQVFLAGLAVVARRAGWDNHIVMGHSLGGPLVLMLLVMFPAKLPSNLKWLTALLFGVYFVQADVVIFLRNSLPYVSALHPVLALFDFLLAQHLVRVSFGLLFSGEAPVLDEPDSALPAVESPNLMREV
jgi:pimeloyl-ACP methyl ester carboxylesterase